MAFKTDIIYGGNTTDDTLSLYNNSVDTQGIVIANTGYTGIGVAPTNLLTVHGTITNDWVAEFRNLNTTAGTSDGFKFVAGGNKTDTAFVVSNAAQTVNFLEIFGDGTVTIANNMYVNGGMITNKEGDDFWSLEEESYFTTSLVVGNNASPATTNVDLEIQGTSDPLIALHNTTSEDIDGGREASVVWTGKQSGNELSTLAKIQASHDGAADDQKGQLKFFTNDGNDGTSPNLAMTINSAQKVGIGETDPWSSLEISTTSPGIALHNTTEEDFAGRDCNIYAFGEQSGGEETTLGRIHFYHEGIADDEKGIMAFYTNSGSDGGIPTLALTIDSSQDVTLAGDIVMSNTAQVEFNNAAADDTGHIRVDSSDVFTFHSAVDSGLHFEFEDASGNSTMEIFGDSVTVGVPTGTVHPDANLWVRKGGAAINTSARTALVVQNDTSTTSNCQLEIISGTSGSSYLAMGDADNTDAGAIEYDNSTDAMTWYIGGTVRWGIVSTGMLIPYTDNGYDIGSAANTPRTMYAHTFNDQTCADFSDYTSQELYDVFKAFKPRTDGILHHSPTTNKYFKHIDMASVPDEFATYTDEDITRHNMYKLKDSKNTAKSFTEAEVLDKQEIEYKAGDKTGIDLGQLVYAQKDMIVKLYEELKDAKERLEVLESV